MRDIYSRDLLTVVEEALQPPAHLTSTQLAAWHARTLPGRLPLIRKALCLAHEEGDAEAATLLVDQAIYEHPNPNGHLPRAVGSDGASLPAPSPASPRTFEGELPIPEHVLCTLLYRHWCMTIVGQPPQETFMAFRPFGWSGEGDPAERITAPTRHELLYRLFHRHLVTKDSDTTQPPNH